MRLALEARDEFWREPANRNSRPRPLVAASLGPYGAFLADGSEYRGDYGLGETELMNFHRLRLATLLEAGPDLLACETLPCLIEARALARLLAEFPDAAAWISFSAVSYTHLQDLTIAFIRRAAVEKITFFHQITAQRPERGIETATRSGCFTHSQ